MEFKVYTNGLPQTIVLSLNSESTLDVKGFDTSRSNTVYFDQQIKPEALQALNGKLEINVPLTADKFILVKITSADGKPFKLISITTLPIKRKSVYLSPADEEYLRCAEWMALYASTIPAGKTVERNGVVFKIFDQMQDESGPSNTPARVDHGTGEVEIAKKFFDRYTVPMRVFILMHERAHYVKDTTDEKAADQNALNICLAMGYPKIEMIYAATKIFPPNSTEARARLAAMEEFISKS